MSETDDAFESELEAAFTADHGATEDTAAEAAALAAAYRDANDEELTAADVLVHVESAPYDGFQHRFDYAIGSLADENEDVTDSREFRLGGFGDLAADPEQGA